MKSSFANQGFAEQKVNWLLYYITSITNLLCKTNHRVVAFSIIAHRYKTLSLKSRSMLSMKTSIVIIEQVVV